MKSFLNSGFCKTPRVRLACSLPAVIFVLLAGALASGQDLDRMYVVGKGVAQQGTVIEIGPTAVKMDSGGQERSFPVNQIKRIEFGDEPRELETGRRQALAGQYNQALTNFGEINVNEISRAVVRDDLAFFKAYATAMEALGPGGSPQSKATAVQAMKGFVTNNISSFHYYKAAKLLGDLEFSAGNYGEAAKYYTSYARAPFPEYKVAAALKLGDALVGSGDFATAKARYQFVVDDSTLTGVVGDKMKQLAAVGVARCLGDTDGAAGVKALEEVIRNGDPADAELFGKAYNAMGNCYLKEGKDQDALLAFLRTDVLFFQDPDMHAEALYHLSNLWKKLNQADRAVRARAVLKQRYGSTMWASKK